MTFSRMPFSRVVVVVVYGTIFLDCVVFLVAFWVTTLGKFKLLGSNTSRGSFIVSSSGFSEATGTGVVTVLETVGEGLVFLVVGLVGLVGLVDLVGLVGLGGFVFCLYFPLS